MSEQKHWTHADIDAVLQEAISLQYELEAMTELAEERRNRAKLAEDTVKTLQAQLALLRAECEVAREWNKLRNAKHGTGVLSDWQRRLSKARDATDAAGALRGDAQ